MAKGKYIRTPEIRKKISKSLTGKMRSQSVCDNLSKIAKHRHIDGTLGNTGKLLSDNTKAKMRVAHLGKKYKPMSIIGKQNISKALIGREISKETRVKMSIAKSGKNAWNWKGGVSRDTHSTREPKYKEWRKAVFSRDNYTCQNKNCIYCNNKIGYILQSHHIKSWATNKDLRYELENGLTLCIKAHRIKYHGWKEN